MDIIFSIGFWLFFGWLFYVFQWLENDKKPSNLLRNIFILGGPICFAFFFLNILVEGLIIIVYKIITGRSID